MPPTAFGAWSNFYVITGSSAAALIGLMFIVITLVAANNETRTSNFSREGSAIFSTPTVVHLCAAFLISGIASVPWPSSTSAGVVLAAAGLSGILLVLSVFRRTLRLETYEPDLEDWTWFTALPLVAYLAVAGTAVMLITARDGAMFVLAAATMLLIFIGIHNSWDIVTYIAVDKNAKPDDDSSRA